MTDKRRALGVRGEKIAADHLRREGYRIIARNYRCRPAEIDLIATVGDILVICEVKTRAGQSMGHPLEAITPAKCERLRRAGELFWLAETDRSRMIRFDVIGISVEATASPSIDHIVDAF